jgi:adenine-specific DNA-methyltransferase
MEKITKDHPAAQSADIVAENIQRLKDLFPEAVTEGRIDFEVLRQLLGDEVDDRDEKYGLNWNGKRRARQLALTPSLGTLRPCPEESVDWDTTKNIFIEGDNLEVLKLLQKSYAGKVKLIYIDPPYNTGKDFVYKDDFQDNIKNYQMLIGARDSDGRVIEANAESSGRFHTEWLNMLLPRLRIARNLLSAEGVLFISIDERELHHLRTLCSDIFGEECFVACLTVLCNPKGRSQDKYFATNHEYILVYSRSVLPKGAFAVAKEEDQIEAEYPEADEDGKYRLMELRNTHREFGKHNRPNLYYSLHVDPQGNVYLDPQSDSQEATPDWEDGFEGCWTWDRNKAEAEIHLLVGREVNGRVKVFRKSYAAGAERMLKTILFDKLFYTERGQKEFNELFDTKDKVFQAPKSPHLLSELIATCTRDNDLIMDFFAGSATFGHAVMQQNITDGAARRYVLIQLPEPIGEQAKEQKVAFDFCKAHGLSPNIAEVSKERLRRAGAKFRKENPLFSGDLGFRVFKLDTSNIRAWNGESEDVEGQLDLHVNHLVDGRTEQDVLYELLLKLGLDLCVPIETRNVTTDKTDKTEGVQRGSSSVPSVSSVVPSFEVHSVGGGVLMVCLATSIPTAHVEGLGLGIVAWHREQAPTGETQVVFRDSAFEDDVAKTNMTAILEQNGIKTVRSL